MGPGTVKDRTSYTGVREKDLKEIEETLTWLKGPDGRTYVKIHTTVYTIDGEARIQEATVLDEE